MLLDTEHASGRKFQTKKTYLKFAVTQAHGRVHCRSKIGCFASITPFDAFEINSQGMFAVEDISC